MPRDTPSTNVQPLHHPSHPGDQALACELRAAVLSGDVRALTPLLERGADPACFKDPGFLEVVVTAGHIDMTLFLAGAGAPINEPLPRGWSALQVTTDADNTGLVRLLLAGADVDVNVPGLGGVRALHLAANTEPRHGDGDGVQQRLTEILTWLLQETEAEVNAQTDAGDTALHHAVPNVERVALLLDAGADPLIENFNGFLPVDVAALSGHRECVALLTRAARTLRTHAA